MREAGFERVEYIELRDAETLMPSDDPAARAGCWPRPGSTVCG
jgi:pantoate--beta-alanine ligase